MIVITDSGSTKADWKFVKDNGSIKEFHTQGFNPFFHDQKEIITVLKSEFKSIVKKDVEKVFYYGAGCSSKERCEIVADALSNIFKNAVVSVDHDLLASARATCGKNPGIACILGTGSNSCSFNGKKIVDNVKNMGFLVGDEGSGSHIGKSLLRGYFYRELPAELKDSFEIYYPGGKEEILSKIYSVDQPNVYLASFSKFLSNHKNHPYVQHIVWESFDEFIRRHVCKYDGHLKVPIHFIGSVAYYFKDILEMALERRAMKLGVVIKKPIDGLVSYHTQTEK